MYNIENAKAQIDSLTHQLYMRNKKGELSNEKIDDIVEELTKLQSYIQSYAIDYANSLKII